MTLQNLPTINATLNAIAAIFLFLGWRAIKAGNRERHRQWMICALVASISFLACYLYYHFTVQLVTKYQGTGILRMIYFLILGTHVPLAALIVPFIIYAVRLAIKGEYERHKKITRWLLPTWMYVSVTGVLVYLMLYVL